MTEKITIDTILNYLQECVENHTPLSPATWLDASLKLNILSGNETDKLAELEMEVARKINKILSQVGGSVAKAKMEVQATETYRDMRKLQAKVKRVEEFIRICKKVATIKDNEMRGY